MKAGRLVHIIAIERVQRTINAAGTPVEEWAPLKTLRAEVVRRTTEEFLSDPGEGAEATVVFRTRFTADVSQADRIAFQGGTYDIEEITQIGRRKGLELRCIDKRPSA